MEQHQNHAKYENMVYMAPKKLEEEVARLHLEKLGVKLTVLTKEQAPYRATIVCTISSARTDWLRRK